MSKKYKAKLTLPNGEEIDIMIRRREIVKLIGRDRRKSITQRILEYLRT